MHRLLKNIFVINQKYSIKVEKIIIFCQDMGLKLIASNALYATVTSKYLIY